MTDERDQPIEFNAEHCKNSLLGPMLGHVESQMLHSGTPIEAIYARDEAGRFTNLPMQETLVKAFMEPTPYSEAVQQEALELFIAERMNCAAELTEWQQHSMLLRSDLKWVEPFLSGAVRSLTERTVDPLSLHDALELDRRGNFVQPALQARLDEALTNQACGSKPADIARAFAAGQRRAAAQAL